MEIDFEKGNGLVPAVIQDAMTKEVLMLGYMDREAYAKTRKEGRVWFYSRSKKRLWMKGEQSGNTIEAVEIAIDCDGDALLIKVEAKGAVCHLGTKSCFKNEDAQ